MRLNAHRQFLWFAASMFILFFLSISAQLTSTTAKPDILQTSSMSLTIEEELVMNSVQNLTHTFTNINNRAFFEPNYALVAKYEAILDTDPSTGTATYVPYRLKPADLANPYGLFKITGFITQRLDKHIDDSASPCYYIHTASESYYIGDVYGYNATLNRDYTMVYRFDFLNNLPTEVYSQLILASSPTVRIQCNNLLRDQNDDASTINIAKYLSINHPLSIRTNLRGQFYEPTADFPFGSPGLFVSDILLTASLIPPQATVTMNSFTLPPDPLAVNATTNFTLTVTTTHIGIIHLNLPVNNLALNAGRIIMDDTGNKVLAVSANSQNSFIPTYNDNTSVTNWHQESVILLNKQYNTGAYTSWALLILSKNTDVKMKFSFQVVSARLVDALVSVSMMPIPYIYTYMQADSRPYIRPKYLLSYTSIDETLYPLTLLTSSIGPPVSADASTTIPDIPFPQQWVFMSYDSTPQLLPQISSTTGRKRAMLKLGFSIPAPAFQSINQVKAANPGSVLTLTISAHIFDRSMSSSESNNINNYTPFTSKDFPYAQIDTSSLTDFTLPLIAQNDKSTTFSWEIPDNYNSGPLYAIIPIYTAITTWRFTATVTLMDDKKNIITTWDHPTNTLFPFSTSGGFNTYQSSTTFPVKFAPSSLTTVDAVNAANDEIKDNIEDAVTTYRDFAYSASFLISPASNTAVTSITDTNDTFDGSLPHFDQYSWTNTLAQLLDIDTVISKGKCSFKVWYSDVNQNIQVITSTPPLAIQRVDEIPYNLISLRNLAMLGPAFTTLEPLQAIQVTEAWLNVDIKATMSCFFRDAITTPSTLAPSQMFAGLRPNSNNFFLFTNLNLQLTDPDVLRYLSIYTGTSLVTSNTYTTCPLYFHGAISLSSSIEQDLIDMLYNAIWSIPTQKLASVLQDTVIEPFTLSQFKQRYIIKITRLYNARGYESYNYQVPALTINDEINGSVPFFGPSIPIRILTLLGFTAYKVNPLDPNDYSDTTGFSALATVINPQNSFTGELPVDTATMFAAYYSSLRNSLKLLQSSNIPLTRSEWNRVALPALSNSPEGFLSNQFQIESYLSSFYIWYTPPEQTYRYDNSCFTRSLGSCGDAARGESSVSSCSIMCPIFDTNIPALRYPIPESLSCRYNSDCGRFISNALISIGMICNKAIRRCVISSETSSYWDIYYGSRANIATYTFPNPGKMDASDAYAAQLQDFKDHHCPSTNFPWKGYSCSVPPSSISAQITPILAKSGFIQKGDKFVITWIAEDFPNNTFSIDWVVKDAYGRVSTRKHTVQSTARRVTVELPLTTFQYIGAKTIKGFTVSTTVLDPVYNKDSTFSTFVQLPDLAVLPICYQVSSDQKLVDACQNGGVCNESAGICTCTDGFFGALCTVPQQKPCPNDVCDLPSDTGTSNCDKNNTFGSECDYEPVTITGGNPSQTTPSPAPPITAPPTQDLILPKTVLPLSQICNTIIDIASKEEIPFNPTKHNEMCSVPTSGSLLVKIRKREIESGVYETDYICNCLCKGYWIDNPLTTDFKKCSKCSLSCPSNMTPNEECTACECVSSKCLSSLKLALPSSSSSSSIDTTTTTTPVPSYTPIQFFSAIYFDLAVLDIIQKPYQHDILTSTSLKQFITTQLQQPSVSLEDTPINQMNYAQQYYLQGSSTKVRNLYNTVMRDVANQIRKKMREDIILDNDENILDDSSFIFDVAIMPLVQSSYLVWKVVYFTTFDKRDYFKKPLDSTIISSMLLNAIKIANPPESQLPTPLPSDTIPTSDITHLAKLITIPLTFAYYDHIITRCATSSSIVSQSPTHPIEMNDLLKCPLATEYMIYKSFNPQIKSEVIDKELTAQRNPLWSKCTSIKYPIYEGLFNSGQIELYTREIYPYCFDFYGINIGGSNNYYIPCTYNLDMSTSSSSNNKLLYYSQHNDKILIPYYLQRMFQSIDLNGVTNIQVNSTIARYKAQYLPEYPQFPQVTTVICDPKEYEIDTSSSPKPSIPITFPPTGMTSTPTVLSPSNHAHIGWSFSGNDQTTITLTVKPFNNTTSTSQNTTQFLWGQIIGEPRPSSSLHATAQLPSVSGSTLFGQIYSQLNGNNNNDNNQQQHPLVTAYTTNGLVFTSFINQNATMMSTQDLSTTTSSLSTLQTTTTTTTTTTTFNLPMLCDSLSIVCDDTTSQFCNQSTGTCECRNGYEIETSSFDQSLKCISICQNSGVYNPITSLCDCTIPGTTGRYCEITDKCHTNHISFITDQIDPKSSSSSTILPQYDKSIADVYTAECNNGYYGYTTVFDEITQQTEDICGGNNNDKKCTCFSPYWNTTESSSSESSLESSQCSTCLLEPLSTDTMKTQIKNTGIQRCYITGTNPITYANGQCTKCICKKGYSGEYCHIHTTYAQFKYQGYKNNEQQYLYDSVNEAILFDKFAHEVMLSLTRYDKDKISVYEHNLKHKYVIIAIQTDLDYFQRNLDEMSSSSLSPFQIQQSIISSLLSLSSLPSSTSDLYQQWLNMQNKFNSTPINNQESNEFLGGVQPPTDSQVYDPSCTEQGYTDCSQTTSFFPEDQHKTTSVVGMIVGIVIAAVCVIALFIIVICVVKYAKKNKKWCYEEKKKKKNDDDSFKVQDNSYKGSTSTPSTIGSTISLMPMSATSGSGNTADSIKSVNNHTEVPDESLVGTDWKAYKDSKHQMFYVNQVTMQSKWRHPIKENDDANDKGW